MGETILMNLIHLFGFHLINFDWESIEWFSHNVFMCVQYTVHINASNIFYSSVWFAVKYTTTLLAMSHYQATNGARNPDEIE